MTEYGKDAEDCGILSVSGGSQRKKQREHCQRQRGRLRETVYDYGFTGAAVKGE